VRRAPGDPERAHGLLEQASATAKTLGMLGLSAATQALLAET
jgi:hypothetical protein